MDSSLARLIEMDLEDKQEWLKTAENEYFNAKTQSGRNIWEISAHETKKTIRMLQNYLNHLAAVEEEQNKKAAV
ncbi:hypothetical protein OYT88_04720 [Sporolactobacillus sp. CQH2019]|uniref:hypothetical protein n=1 Tax=Sporolactobacillus sp. CQH2019 TaxID=3023512 RepID=UPI0023682481|nr:hypothetical protein [Sporolactobacillus sp. CQH2019]MDD9147852.1 hypothetical protein [Sporolactobacillus sp. CQH2019]